jgi:hypothetical protein
MHGVMLQAAAYLQRHMMNATYDGSRRQERSSVRLPPAVLSFMCVPQAVTAGVQLVVATCQSNCFRLSTLPKATHANPSYPSCACSLCGPYAPTCAAAYIRSHHSNQNKATTFNLLQLCGHSLCGPCVLQGEVGQCCHHDADDDAALDVPARQHTSALQHYL